MWQKIKGWMTEWVAVPRWTVVGNITLASLLLTIEMIVMYFRLFP